MLFYQDEREVELCIIINDTLNFDHEREREREILRVVIMT